MIPRLEHLETLATKNKPALALIGGVKFEVRRIVKSKHRRFSYRHGDRHMARDEAEAIFCKQENSNG